MAWLTPQLDFFLQCRKGRIEGHNVYIISGSNSNTNATESAIWNDDGEIYYPTSAEQFKVSSTDANDTAAGTGAQTVMVKGLDEDFEEISETIALNGQTEVTTTNSYYRINGIKVATVGSGGANAGTIYVGKGTVTAGKPANVTRIIETGLNTCKCGYFTVPARMTAFRVNHFFGNFDTNVASFRWRIRHAGAGKPWYYTGEIPIATGTQVFSNQASRGHSTGTDVEFRSSFGSSTGRTTMFAEYILADSRSG